MLTIPFVVNNEIVPNVSSYCVFVVLEDENLGRIKEYDPAELMPEKMGEPWCTMSLRKVYIGYANEEDKKKILELANAGQPEEIFRLLSRGWRFRPESGDNDAPYLSSKTGGLRH